MILSVRGQKCGITVVLMLSGLSLTVSYDTLDTCRSRVCNTASSWNSLVAIWIPCHQTYVDTEILLVHHLGNHVFYVNKRQLKALQCVLAVKYKL